MGGACASSRWSTSTRASAWRWWPTRRSRASVSPASSIIVAVRGRPGDIVSDNGTELTSTAILAWSDRQKVAWNLWLPKIASVPAQLPRWATLIAGMIDLLKLLGGLLVGVFRSHAAREAEMAFLRQQLVVLQRSAPARLRLRSADRAIFVWLYRLFPSLLEAAVVFKPETLVRWHRSGFRLYWRCKSRRRVGRPAVPADIRDLIRTISRDNPLWGAPRIHGELLKLGIDIAQST